MSLGTITIIGIIILAVIALRLFYPQHLLFGECYYTC